MTAERRGEPLDERQLHPDPAEQFRRWLGEVTARAEAERMTLATTGLDGAPSARIVLLRGVTPRGLVFFTNYRSRKARDIDHDPRVALLFHWPSVGRQVRVEGVAERLEPEASDAYFRRRPLASRLSAIASPQSEPIGSREELRERVRLLVQELRRDRGPIRRPDHWGGYRVVPRSFEFWQGGRSRLHDRLRYRETEPGRWIIERLAP